MAPRHTLSRSAFVEAALGVVDEGGSSKLTARVIGETVGADPSALYRHFRNIDDLAGAVLDHLFGMMLELESPDGTPRQRLRAHCMNVHRTFLAHPNVLGLLLVSDGDFPNGERITRRGLELLRATGLSGESLAECHQLLESFLIGVHVYDLAGSPYHLEIRFQRRRRLNDPEIDAANRTVEDVGRVNSGAFEAGLDAILDLCEARSVSALGRSWS